MTVEDFMELSKYIPQTERRGLAKYTRAILVYISRHSQKITLSDGKKVLIFEKEELDKLIKELEEKK